MRLLKRILLLVLLLTGCSVSDVDTQKISDVDFTVVPDKELSQEIKDIIEEKKKDEFKVVFTVDENMYIAIGYGAQKTSGYSIIVDELYMTKDSVHIATSLLGPKKGEVIHEEETYPYIVVMIENTEYPIVFD